MTIYLDVNTEITLNTNSLLVADYEAINNSIHNILSTSILSVPWVRSYGSGLEEYLFQPVSGGTAEDIRVTLLQALSTWEPRIVIDVGKTGVYTLDTMDGYQVSVAYSVPSLEYRLGVYSALLVK